MVEFRNMDSGGTPDLSDEVVTRVGKAIGQITAIRQAYRADMAAADTDDEKHELAQRIELQAVTAVGDQGLTIEQYNDVVTAAEDDPDLEERLLTAAREA